MNRSKKYTVVILSVLMFFSFFCFAEESYRTFFPKLADSPIYPTEKNLGQICSSTASSAHTFLSQALKEPYSFEWLESYVSEDSRKTIAGVYSKSLSNNLNNGFFLLSKAYSNSDGSVSISVKFMETNEILTFIIEHNQIIGISEEF